MEKWKPLNMELRSWVISQVLRLEQTTSELLRTIFRVFSKDTKTLGNKSSAFSFKAKIDLLYDLEEIDRTEYSQLLKIMEIRNQFAHNHNAVTFESLDEINSEINKYLLRFEPDNFPDDILREEKLKHIFGELFKKLAGKLLACQIEYTGGLQNDVKQYVNDKVVENIETIWNRALEKNKESKAKAPIALLMNGSESEIEDFYYDFRVAISEYSLEELEKGQVDNGKKIFKRKSSIEDMAKIMLDEEE